jgi:hypothetical protein
MVKLITRPKLIVCYRESVVRFKGRYAYLMDIGDIYFLLDQKFILYYN